MDNPLDSSFDPAFHVAKSYRRQCRDYDLSLLGAPPAGIEAHTPSVTWRPARPWSAQAAPPPPPADLGACSPDPDDGDEGDGDPLGVWVGLWNCLAMIGAVTLVVCAAWGATALLRILGGN